MEHFKRMNYPTSSALIKGLCGDEMEMYLYILKGVIEEVAFFSENGCEDTKMAGEIVAQLAEKKDIMSALEINPRLVINRLKRSGSESDGHCSILAVSALYKALADYLLLG
jgi:NifU-like protein involved in Fe-S cluster formation